MMAAQRSEERPADSKPPDKEERRGGTRARLSELLGLGVLGLSSKPAARKSPRGPASGDTGRQQLVKQPRALLSPHRSCPRHAGATLFLSSLQPPHPVAASAEDQGESEQQVRFEGPTEGHVFAALGSQDCRQVPMARTMRADAHANPPSSNREVARDGRLVGSTEDQQEHRSQHIPQTPTPGGPQTPSLTPSSLSVTSCPDEVCGSVQENFEIQSWLGDTRQDSRADTQAACTRKGGSQGYHTRDEDDTETESAATIEESAVQLLGLGSFRTSSNTALLGQEIFELSCKMTKRLALEGWNCRTVNREQTTLLAQFRERNLSIRNAKVIAFSTWIRHIMSARNIVNQCGARDKLLRNALRLRDSIVRRTTKRQFFEAWNRHTSVMNWTHGRLRLAAHKSRVISLRGTFARLQTCNTWARMKRATIARTVKWGERMLLQRMWMALVGHLIDVQLQDSQLGFDLNSVSGENCESVFELSRIGEKNDGEDRYDAVGAPPQTHEPEDSLANWHNCRRDLPDTEHYFAVSPQKHEPENSLASWHNCKQDLPGRGHYFLPIGESGGEGEEVVNVVVEKVMEGKVLEETEMQNLLERHVILSQSQETLISKLRDRLDSQEILVSKTKVEMAREKARSVGDALSLKRLQKKILEDSVALRQHERRERQLILQLLPLTELRGQARTVGNLSAN